jgi:hypothetical protein
VGVATSFGGKKRNHNKTERKWLMTGKYREITFADSDVVNKTDFIPAGEYNPHNVRPWLIHDHGTTICIVFAANEQDALDTAVDEDKLDPWQISESEMADYGPEGEGITYLGNAGETFDIETLGMIELPNPPFSFVALFNARSNGN